MTQSLWEDFYRRTKDEDIPWNGLSSDFYDNTWTGFELPKKGNILDVGCGTGDKALFLAKKGFKVWGLDISETAVERARAKAEGLKNKPKFFRQDALEISKEDSLNGVKFDVVFDILCTHFLKNSEKLVYLKGLSKFIKPGKTFYILVNFTKENNPPKDQPSWIQEIAMSGEDVKETYGRYFEVIDRVTRSEQKGKADRYILKARKSLL